MSRSLNSVNVNQTITFGPSSNPITLVNDNGVLLIQSSGTSFDLSPSGIQGPTGFAGPTGLAGPTGSDGSLFTVEVLSGTSTVINPNANISILRGGNNYTLSTPSANGAFKYIIDDVDRNYANRIAAWNGTGYIKIELDTIRTNGFNGSVNALGVDTNNQYLYAGGAFTTVVGTGANYVARFDGTTWTALGSGTNGTVSTLVVNNIGGISPTGTVYIGGSFTQAGGTAMSRITQWDGSNYTSLGTGLSDANLSLVIDPVGIVGPIGNLYAGGSFTNAGGVLASRIARWDGSQWNPLATGIAGNVNALVIDPFGSIGPTGNLYAGGSFTTAGGTAGINYITRWNGTGWFNLGVGLGNVVNALVIDPVGSIGPRGNLYAGGLFTTAGGIAANRIARWDGFTWNPLATGLGANSVTSLAIDTLGSFGPTGNLYAGGDFTLAGGAAANRIARWDGTGWYPLATGVNSTVSSLSSYENQLYLGGNFTTLNPSFPTVSISGEFFSSSAYSFYNTIRTVSSNIGRQQGLIWVNDIGAWTVINNAEIFSYTNI